ncbi:hypothetical protein [Pleurocapsa sp. PCC 7319]|uniref:cyclic electron transport protein PGR5 n=1 Tax=Pleurocapsa sp. PCC 7319 TaxID=118161 RepID=UPI0003451F51|nr:hypothetical protein [Pleurocapsa sp. PCC 7319]
MFAPIVIQVRNRLGKVKFNQLRGKAIALHSQVITKICNRFDIERTTRQNLIRTARDNGKRLGLLA